MTSLNRESIIDPTVNLTLWISKKDGHIGRLEDVNDSSFTFRGERYETEAIPTIETTRFFAFRETWRIVEFRRFRPLIYFAASGGERSFEMLNISLTSMLHFAAYDGEVLIISNRSREITAEYLPAELGDAWFHFEVGGRDILDYATARYRITDWPQAMQFGPSLYVDTDVLFDAPIQPILSRIALSERLSGQAGSGPLWRDMGVGAHLLSADGFVFPETFEAPQGFCTGTIGIPCIADATSDLKTIVAAIERYAKAENNRVIGWYDQPTVNYIMFSLYGECEDTLVPFVRWGGKNALHGGDRPLGLVHLWGAADKLAEMEELFGLLTGRLADTTEWNVYGREGKLSHAYMRA